MTASMLLLIAVLAVWLALLSAIAVWTDRRINTIWKRYVRDRDAMWRARRTEIDEMWAEPRRGVR